MKNPNVYSQLIKRIKKASRYILKELEETGANAGTIMRK
jgi:ABC-type nitrate/sulfonate/bicarbonate transport system substrate-binding protein